MPAHDAYRQAQDEAKKAREKKVEAYILKPTRGLPVEIRKHPIQRPTFDLRLGRDWTTLPTSPNCLNGDAAFRRANFISTNQCEECAKGNGYMASCAVLVTGDGVLNGRCANCMVHRKECNVADDPEVAAFVEAKKVAEAEESASSDGT
ncbi:hypothetical protein PG984_011209 [Apiospora sp. TS-2023a]